jgi:4'-phosphopantetheinyl transferase
LSADERARRDRLLRPEDQQAFTVCRAALRQHLGERVGRDPATLIFGQNRYGKPHLHDRVVCFNVSHSADRGLIAISDDDVGVDIEHQRPLHDMMAVAKQSFSPQEQADLWRLPMPLRREGFFRCWSRKEAFIKAVGMGLSFPLDGFDVTLDPRVSAQLLGIRDPQHARAGWTLHHLDVVPEYSAALVTRGPAQIRIMA